ncbi:MAG: hypothetical protein IIA45_00330 [Bacteroidetes bacterium]|nr:hypothetical protein [Bacteroidota bacterium]
MTTGTKKVLLISFTFPPAPGIGGRRWVKFAKYLNTNNVDVKVIAAINQMNEISPWLHDLELIKNNITYINSGYPKYLGIKPRTFQEKVLYRISKWYSMLKLKGNYYDSSAHWSKRLIPIIEKEIANGYNNLIVTCAPFIQAYLLSNLKNKFPEINFIVDFRDPWANNKTSYGFTSLSKKRMNFEINAEKKVINKADYIISVSENMTEYFKHISHHASTNKNKFVTIVNGFDRHDLPEKTNEKIPGDKLRLIFTGTLYIKAMHLFQEFIGALNNIKKNSPHLYKIFQFDFYGDVPDSFFDLVQNHEAIRYGGVIPLDQVHYKIARSHLGMLFLTDDLNYSFSTKFYEYLANDTPIVCFSKKGKTSEFIAENKIGYALNENQIEKSLLDILEHHENNILLSVDHFDISEYEISKLTQGIIQLLK